MIKAPIRLQDLRRRLYVKAKAEPTWRFWGLYVHVCKRETLWEAYQLARENDGAPGIDGVTFQAIEAGGLERFLEQLREELVKRSYRPRRLRKVKITERRREDSPTFDTLHPRPSGPGCVEVDPGTDLRGRFPTGVVWLPAEEVSPCCAPTRLGSDLEATHLRDRLRSASLL